MFWFQKDKYKKKITSKFKNSSSKNIKNIPKAFILTGAISADSVFNCFYHLSKIDPSLINTIDRLHFKNEGSLSEIINYTKNNITNDGLQDYELNKYKGYLGEEKHIQYLQEQGLNVEIPQSPTQEGYDLIIDDKYINVKITENNSYLNDHLENYPDIPIHTGDSIFNDDKVEIFSHLGNEELLETASLGFENIEAFGESFFCLPFFTTTISALKNSKKIRLGDKSTAEGLRNIAIDTATTSLCIGFGAAIGTTIIPVPGIGTIFGGILGGFFAKKTNDKIKKYIYDINALKKEYENNIDNLKKNILKFKKNIENILEKIKKNRKNNSRKKHINHIHFKKLENQQDLIKPRNRFTCILKKIFPSKKEIFLKWAIEKNKKDEYLLKKEEKIINLDIENFEFLNKKLAQAKKDEDFLNLTNGLIKKINYLKLWLAKTEKEQLEQLKNQYNLAYESAKKLLKQLKKYC